MKIFVDADACPNTIKNILYKAVKRLKKLKKAECSLILVANTPLSIPPHSLITSVHVNKGFDEADNYIVEHVEQGDLVVTADIPLASDVIDKKALALNPRGELYSTENIKSRLAKRNRMDELRSCGIHTSGPKKMENKDSQKFANALDRLLTKYFK